MQTFAARPKSIGPGRSFLTFLIESLDGRTRICTASADMAVEHYKALRAKGIEATISDITGTNYTLKNLHKHAELHSRQRDVAAAGGQHPERRFGGA